MNVTQLASWIQAGNVLIAGGVATVKQVSALIQLMHPDMTEPQLNQILEGLQADAARRADLARQDQAQAAADAVQN